MPTKIEWTHMPGYTGESWNLIAGCTKISPGCANCYAETMGLRFHRSGLFLPGNPIRLLPERLSIPFRWKNPRMVFVNSTSDTFHEDVPNRFILEIFKKALFNRRHIFIFLTKRPERMLEWFNSGWYQVQLREWAGLTYQTLPLDNVWLGTSAENQYWANIRIPKLLECPAVIHYASLEPLLGPIDLWNLKQPSGITYDALLGWLKPTTLEKIKGLDQIIIGGESGNSKKTRPMHPDWALSLRDQTRMYKDIVPETAFFMKQWGAYRPMTPLEIKSEPYRARIVSLDPHERQFTRAIKDNDAWMIKGSKGGNGNLLDGEVWEEFPATGNKRIAS